MIPFFIFRNKIVRRTILHENTQYRVFWGLLAIIISLKTHVYCNNNSHFCNIRCLFAIFSKDSLRLCAAGKDSTLSPLRTDPKFA